MEKIRLVIAGTEYAISTDDDLDYVAQLGEDLNKRMQAIMTANSRASVTQAAVLTALEYADEAAKGAASAENLRTKIQEYLEDAGNARTEAEIAKREIERLNREIDRLKDELGK